MRYLGLFVLHVMLFKSPYICFRWKKSEIFREQACILYCYVRGCLLRTVYIMGLLVTAIIFSFICPRAVFLRRRFSFTEKLFVCIDFLKFLAAL